MDAVDPYRFGNVFEPALADVFKGNLDDLADLLVNGLRDQDPARLRHLLEADRDVDAGAVKVVAFGDHVAQIDADAEPHPLFLGHFRVASGHLFLDRERAAEGFDNAGKLGNQPVAGAAENTASVLRDQVLDNGPMRTQGGCRGFFVGLGEPAVPLHVSRENCGKPPFHDRGAPSRMETFYLQHFGKARYKEALGET